MPGETSGRGRLVVLSAPSGAGKTTLVRALLEREPRLRFSVSYTTRRKRPAEVEGRDYFFVTEAEFRRMIDEDEFLEYASVFDHWYGTSRRHVEQLLAGGDSVLLEIDWQGARQVRERAPDASSVFILPPSVAELERRLRGRGTDSEETVERRLGDAVADIGHWDEFDYVIVNDDVEHAARALEAIIAGRGAAHGSREPLVREAARRVLDGAGAC
jgi:guanylate kinase